MLTIYLHQLRDHLQSTRFQISLLVLLLFFAANGVVYTWKLAKLQEEVMLLDRADERAYQDLVSVKSGVSEWFRNLGRHPSGAEFIVDGGVDLLKTALWTCAQTGTLPSLWWALTRNAIIDSFQVIDWSLIVRFVIPFLCVVLAYDTVSRDLESGTLRLILSNPVSRISYLAGKGLAHLTTVLLGFAVGSTVSLIALGLGGRLVIGVALLAKLAVFLLGVAAFATSFVFLAVGVSALARSSASSIVILVLVWTVAVVILPQMSALIGLQTAAVPHGPERDADQYYEAAQRALTGQGLTFRGVAVGALDGYAQERQAAEQLREAEKEQERIYREALRRQARQWQIARTINLLSPSYAFQYGVEAVLGVGAAQQDALQAQNWEYRQQLREFLQQTDTADPASAHIRFFPEYMSANPIDPRQIPRFHEPRPSLAEGVQVGAVPLLILLLEMVGSVLFAHWAMLRTDVASE